MGLILPNRAFSVLNGTWEILCLQSLGQFARTECRCLFGNIKWEYSLFKLQNCVLIFVCLLSPFIVEWFLQCLIIFQIAVTNSSWFIFIITQQTHGCHPCLTHKESLPSVLVTCLKSVFSAIVLFTIPLLSVKQCWIYFLASDGPDKVPYAECMISRHLIAKFYDLSQS